MRLNSSMAYTVTVKDEVLEIITSKGQTLLADSSLSEELTKCKWNVPQVAGTPYGRWSGKTITLRKLVVYLMTGEWITKSSRKCIVHVNENQLDCRFENLRVIPKGEVLAKPRNKVQKRSKSGCPGVVWNNQTNKWWVYAYKNKKQIYLGCSSDLDEAIKMRKDYLEVNQ